MLDFQERPVFCRSNGKNVPDEDAYYVIRDVALELGKEVGHWMENRKPL